MRKALVLAAALLLSGCASEDPAADAVTDVAGAVAGTPFDAAPVEPLSFASGDYEGVMEDSATFSITAPCFIDCSAGGEAVFDLSDIIPAEAPVELTVTVQGARAMIEYVDASAVRSSQEENGQGTDFGLIVVRGESGQVLLHVYNPGGFNGFPPNPAPTATFEARSVVRAERLVAGVPAEVKLQPGDIVNLTGEAVDEAILIAPDGALTRDSTEPFSLMANGTAGLYTILMLGQDSTYVYGPATTTTMAAKRLAVIEQDPVPLTSGSATTWSFDSDVRPLAVGLEISSVPTPGMPFPISAGSTMTQFEATITGPSGAELASDGMACTPFCGFFFGGFSWAIGSEYLDERLQPGTYDVSVTYTGNGMQASTWTLVIA